MTKRKKSLVTGGAGFIGSHLVDSLLDLGHDVVALDDLSGGFVDNVNKQADFVEGSILDENLINELFEKHEFNYVYHLAAYAAEGLSHFIRGFNYRNNLIGSVNLLNASIKTDIDLFVFTSSIAVYGGNVAPMREDMVPSPEDPYGVAKYAVEMDLVAAHEMFGLDYMIFRPYNVVGERQNIGDKYRNVVGIFMNQAMQGKPMTIFGDGEQTRAFTYVKDVAPTIAKAYMHPNAYNQVFNIGADKPYTVNQLSKMVSDYMGVEHNVIHLEERKEVKHAYSETNKLGEYFGYKVEHSLDDALKSMSEWAKKYGPRESKKFDNIEIEKNLPPSWRDGFDLKGK